MSDSRRKRPAVRPHKALYYFALSLIKLVVTPLFRPRIRRSAAFKAQRGGMLIFGNHASYLDPLFLALAAGYRRRVSFLAASFIFNKPLFRGLLRGLGVIPTVQFTTSAQSTRAIIKRVREGGTVALYPEGERCLLGRSGAIEENAAKLVKQLGVAVAGCVLRGAYLTWPRWSRGRPRFSGLEVEMDIIFSAEELRTLALGDIARRLQAALAADDYAWQAAAARPRRYVGRRGAEGLERLLFACPSCGAFFKLRSAGRSLGCSACGCEVRLAATGGFAQPLAVQGRLIRQPLEWWEAQKAMLSGSWPVAARWPEGAPGAYPARCRALGLKQAAAGEALRPESSGRVRIDGRGLRYEAQAGEGAAPADAAAVYELPFAAQKGVMIEDGVYAQLIHGDRLLRLYFDEPCLPAYIRALWEIDRAR